MRAYTRAVRQSLGVTILSLCAVSLAGASASFFNYAKLPFPYEATGLVAQGSPIALQSHEVLIEGYVLTRSGRPIEWVAVYPGALNQLSETVPGALAVTDSNGFFSIVVDRERYTHLAVGCLAPRRRGEQDGPVRAFGLVVLPRAEVSQAERTLRLDLSPRIRRCSYPIEGPPEGVYFPQ